MDQHKHKCPQCGQHYICTEDSCAGMSGQPVPIPRICPPCLAKMPTQSAPDGESTEPIDKMNEMIEYLSGLSIEASEVISEERRSELIKDMTHFFLDHCDQNQFLNFAEMVFIFARSLRFSLLKLRQGCEGCEHCEHPYDPSKETIH